MCWRAFAAVCVQDKNAAPLNQLDVLMEETYDHIMELTHQVNMMTGTNVPQAQRLACNSRWQWPDFVDGSVFTFEARHRCTTSVWSGVYLSSQHRHMQGEAWCCSCVYPCAACHGPLPRTAATYRCHVPLPCTAATYRCHVPLQLAAAQGQLLVAGQALGAGVQLLLLLCK
jgi:hypothetical protein